MAIRKNISAPQTGRVSRRPSHSWNVRALPWQIQPVMIAPVIPGETLKSAIFQERVVTDPIRNRLMGWWHDLYLYYVPLLATSEASAFESMVIDPEYSAAALVSNTAVADHYFAGRSMIDYVKLCLAAVTEQDFRNEGEAWNDFMINGLPAASINRTDFTHSMMAQSDFTTDFAIDVDANADDTITAQEVDAAMRQYELLREMGLVEMSYEDYLRTYGIRGREVQEAKGPTPELLRYVRDWQYPANTPDATGQVASVVSWRIAERADKDRFFKHPGFIFGCSVTRPKVYLGNTLGAAVGALQTIRDWLPAMTAGDAYAAMKLFAEGTGPVDTAITGDEGYWLDLRDLFVYGDQFVNHGAAAEVALPNTGNLQRKYATLADVAPLFVGEAADPTLASIVKTDPIHVEADGVISLTILGRTIDKTHETNRLIV